MGLLGDSAPYKCTLNANILESKCPLCSKMKSKGCGDGGCGLLVPVGLISLQEAAHQTHLEPTNLLTR